MFEGAVVVIDMKGHLLGRAASMIAKELLCGQQIVRISDWRASSLVTESFQGQGSGCTRRSCCVGVSRRAFFAAFHLLWLSQTRSSG